MNTYVDLVVADIKDNSDNSKILSKIEELVSTFITSIQKMSSSSYSNTVQSIGNDKVKTVF